MDTNMDEGTAEAAEGLARTPFRLAGRNKPAAAYTGPPDLALEVEEIIMRSAAASLLDGHDRAALLYFGGAESGLLLHLLGRSGRGPADFSAGETAIHADEGRHSA